MASSVPPPKELLRQQSDTVPGITVQIAVNPPTPAQPPASEGDPQPVPTIPSRLKISALRPLSLFRNKSTVIPEEGIDESQLPPQIPREPPTIHKVRFPNQSKSTLDSYAQHFDPKVPSRPTDIFRVPQEPRFIRLVLSKADSDAIEPTLKSINIVFVNLVTALPGEQDKTWTFEKVATDSKTPSEKPAVSDGTSTAQKPGPQVVNNQDDGLLQTKQRRVSATPSMKIIAESLNYRSSQESLVGEDPSPYVNGGMVQTSGTRSSLERSGQAQAGEDMNATKEKNVLRRNISLRRGDSKGTKSSRKRASEVNQVNWLIDPGFLSKGIPEARVIQYGYCYDPEKPLTSEFYDDVSNNLLGSLTPYLLGENEDNAPLDGPVLFVAAGDAGFVVEKVIIGCVDYKHPIVELIAGVIFLATPFVGSKTFCKNIGKVIGRPVLSVEKEFFGRKSVQVAELSANFKKRIQTIGIPIWCFQTANWSVHASDIFEIATSKLSNEYHEIGCFESADDTDYLKVMEMLLNFTNGRQLMDAAKEGEVERLQAILEKKDGEGIEVDHQDVLGRTALHASTRNKMEEVTEWLVKFGNANVRLADGDGFTALHYAVQSQSVRSVRLLLEAGADVRAQASISVAQKSPLEMARYLAKEKEKLDPKAKYRDDPIYWQLTHRPFLLEPSSYVTLRKLKGPKAPTSQEAIDTCNHHTLAAVEFFEGKGPVRDSRSVFDMIYTSEGPMETLDKALELALQNEREELGSNAAKGKGKTDDGKPESVSRWYHIPANNMVWVQDFLLKVGLDVPSSSWMTEKHEGPTPHSRFMRPFAKTIVAHHDGKEKKILAFCMPFLDYESTSGRVKMAKHIKNKLFADRFGRLIAKLFANYETRLRNSKYPPLPPSDSGSDSENEDSKEPADIWSGDQAPSTTDAPTVGTSNDPDEDFDADFKKAKKSIIDAYLTHKLPVHVRRTLDQYYYYMLPDTEHRDKDQVVYRHQKRSLYRKKEEEPDAEAETAVSAEIRRKNLKQLKLLMVDQLWLWYIPRDKVFKSDIVLTCFPRRWCQNNAWDPDLLESILKFEGRASPISDINSLIGLITSKCANIFDRSTAPSDMQFMEYFESAIGKAADDETNLFDVFDRLSKQLNLDEKTLPSEKRAEVLDKFLKIDDETKLLIDVKDIQDEISTILLVLKDQNDVLKKVATELGKFSPLFEESSFWDKHQMIGNNIRDFEKMEGQAKKTYDALNHLLELKTRQANAWEARFARKGGEEVARQGKTIFWFTVVTIIFLPLSFMASFMALNIKQFPKDNSPGGQGGTSWELGFASSILFGISFAMSIPLVILAFNVSAVQRFLEAHLFTAFVNLIARFFRFVVLKWNLYIAIRAWLPKLLSRLQYKGYLPDPLPDRLEAWKDLQQEEFDNWKLDLDRANEDAEERQRRLEKDMENDEKRVFGDDDGSDSESEDDAVEDDATTLARSQSGGDENASDEEKDGLEGEQTAGWDIFGLKNRTEKLRRGAWGQEKDGVGEKGDANV